MYLKIHLENNRVALIVPVIVLLLSIVPTTVFAQGQQPSIHDQICKALQVRNVAILGPLLATLHLITPGASTPTILHVAAAYCS
jgi:hypothetical protein